jgi:secreted trypsin-like serine protease
MTSINLKIILFVSISLLINLSNCIKTKNQQKIYGGSSAKYLGWPWQALIQFQDEFKCGGTLINDEWILTAAHCVERTSQASMYKVILGEHNMEIKEGDEIYCDVDKVSARDSVVRFNFNTQSLI